MKTARDKLNAVAIKGALFVGGLVALIFQSIPVGVIAAAGIFLASLTSGDFRPEPQKKRNWSKR